ncbi:MAG TPA: hypothetical protein VFA41_12335 [Ktedonobacteraceae bacterium]|jgi:hypothetical protein|nr:hypothetical protein [Ktedonobacteraceae bacterium]
MSSLSKQEQLRSLIDEQQERMRQTFPAQRDLAVVALIRARDWRYLALHNTLHTPAWNAPSPIFYLCTSGWQKALQLCYSAATASFQVASGITDSSLDAWAEQVLQECDRLAAGEQVLAYCETGFMRMQQGGQRDCFAWIASKHMPTEWREREDLAWWANALVQTHTSEIRELAAENASIQQQLVTFAREWRADTNIYSTTRAIDDYYHRLGMLWVRCMACHLQYPAETVIGGCAIELYRKVLAVLIGWALKHLDLCRIFVAQQPSFTLRALLAPVHAADALIEALSETPGVERTAIGRVVDAFCLDQKNVSWHCSVAGVPAPPLVRLNDRRLVWSLAGLLGEPFLFLTRELKRRDSYEYHTASHSHEEVFRQDLYALFSDKRFVKSAGSVVLKGVQGDLTTDVDALIFDRKTGALALFELKSQDPFAYSRQERIRQRDYFQRAGKQVLACVQWLNRNGANALLTRLDFKQVKRLKVQKTYIFVLGRYLAHFFDGPEFDRRAAWGTWPQVLRLVNGASFGPEDANPILSLYNKLLKDTPLAPVSPMVEVQEIPIGESHVYVYPDFQTYKRGVGEMGGVE